MALHIGKTIQKLVKSKGISVTDFASKINYSRRNVYEIFEKETIDTGLLIKIGKILDENLFLHYISDADLSSKSKNNKPEDILPLLLDIKKTVDSLKVKKPVSKKK